MNRDRFKSHKAVFERDVLLPFRELTEQVIQGIYRLDPSIHIDFKQAAFRIHRDTRFSKDKSPYKLWMGAVVSREGRKNTRWPEIYFQLGLHTNFIGAGLYRPDKETLNKIRYAIAENPGKFRAVLTDAEMLEYFPGGITGERNKRLPDKYLMEVSRECPYVLNKQFITFRSYPRERFIQPGIAGFIVAHYKAMAKFNAFLNEIQSN
jgi:uncharacterized protein (TIGR02453 family)